MTEVCALGVPSSWYCSSEDTSEDGSDDKLVSVSDPVELCYRVGAMGEAKKASPALQTFRDLSNVEIVYAQELDPNLRW